MKQPIDAFQMYRDKAAGMRDSRNISRRRLRETSDITADPWAIPLQDLNVAQPELFKEERVGPWFERLRKEAPVHYCADSQYGPYWSITRFDDIMEIERDAQRFSSDARLGGVLINGTPQTADYVPMFIQMDSPQHDVQRAAVAPRFAPTKLGELQDLIRQRAAAILDGLPLGEPFDWVSHVSKNLTGQMLATLLGIPIEEREQLIAWSDIIANPDNPEIVPSFADYYLALAEVGEYFCALWNEREALDEPGFDLISMMAHGEGTRHMSAQEFVGNLTLLITGGNDTTRNSISGGLYALNQYPDQFADLRAHPEKVANMVPEIIRWQTPLSHMARTATEDVEFRGQQISKGDRVIMWYLSGNRDPDVIADPEAFDINRKNPRHHLSFGFGIHRCLGNRLAEMQLRILWEEILPRFSDIKVLEEPERVSSCMFHGYSKMMVEAVA